MNLPHRAVVRPLTSCLAATALVVSVLVPVAADAAPAPGARPGGAAATVVAARPVTPPSTVSKKQLIRIFRAAARATDAGLRRGASLRSVEVEDGERTVGTGRARAGRILERDSSGFVRIVDARSGWAYVSLAPFATVFQVSGADLDAALVALGKPGATWMALPRPPGRGSEVAEGLIEAAKAATSWSWRRHHGLTTWRLTAVTRVPFSTVRTTQVFVLDSRQRVVHQSEKTVSPDPMPLPPTATRSAQLRTATTTSTLDLRYRPVSPIAIPAPDQTVGYVDFWRALDRVRATA